MLTSIATVPDGTHAVHNIHSWGLHVIAHNMVNSHSQVIHSDNRGKCSLMKDIKALVEQAGIISTAHLHCFASGPPVGQSNRTAHT